MRKNTDLVASAVYKWNELREKQRALKPAHEVLSVDKCFAGEGMI